MSGLSSRGARPIPNVVHVVTNIQVNVMHTQKVILVMVSRDIELWTILIILKTPASQAGHLEHQKVMEKEPV